MRLAEVRKAVAGLNNNRTPGPDGIPAEIFRKMPSLFPYLCALLTAIYRTGDIPEALRRIYVILLHKPGKDPRIPEKSPPHLTALYNHENSRDSDLPPYLTVD